jgi:ABC-type hemin transport system, periplasmic component
MVRYPESAFVQPLSPVLRAMPVLIDRRTVLFAIAGLFLCSARGQAGQSRRLVTIGAPLTEIVYALGAGSEVVGTDTTSRNPAETAALPKVGYMRTLSAEGLLSLSPSHVLAQEGSGPRHVLDQLAGLGVDVTLIPETPNAEGLVAKVRTIAAKIGRLQAGHELAGRLAAQFASLEAGRTGQGGLHGQLTLCLIHAGNGGPLAAGEGTVADTLIRLAGGRNAMAPMTDYKPLSVEAAIAAAPQVLLVSDATVAQAGGMEAFLSMPQLAQTPAAAFRRVAVVDGALLLGLGPRTPEAVRLLASVRAGT